jgi:hypothetical protein
MSFSTFFSREERCYVSGRLDGPAKYFYTSGAVETRIYESGVLQGLYLSVIASNGNLRQGTLTEREGSVCDLDLIKVACFVKKKLRMFVI